MPGVGEEKTPDEIFLEFDADDSGEIDKSELVMALGGAGVTVTTAQVDKLMSIIDTDNDGKISKAEFRAFVGTSKMLSTEDVVNKMEASFATAIRGASNPIDVASISISQANHANRAAAQRSRDSDGADFLQNNVENPLINNIGWFYLIGCTLCICGLGLLVAYIYGVAAVTGKYLGAETSYKGKGTAQCEAGTTWVSVICIAGLAQIVISQPVQQYVSQEDPARTGMMARVVKYLTYFFHCLCFVWCIYGCTIFYNESIQHNCEAAMWKFGFNFIICYFVAFVLMAIAMWKLMAILKQLVQFQVANGGVSAAAALQV